MKGQTMIFARDENQKDIKYCNLQIFYFYSRKYFIFTVKYSKSYLFYLIFFICI